MPSRGCRSHEVRPWRLAPASQAEGRVVEGFWGGVWDELVSCYSRERRNRMATGKSWSHVGLLSGPTMKQQVQGKGGAIGFADDRISPVSFGNSSRCRVWHSGCKV